MCGNVLVSLILGAQIMHNFAATEAIDEKYQQ